MGDERRFEEGIECHDAREEPLKKSSLGLSRENHICIILILV